MGQLQDIYNEGMEKVGEIDVQLDSLTDQETAGKRKVGNDLIEASKAEWENFLQGAITQMETMSPEIQVGVYLALQKGLKEKFDAPTTEFVSKKVAEMPPIEPLISEEEAEVLRKTRSALYQQIKSVRELAIQVGEASDDDPSWVMPKMRRGASGKRGKRALSLMTWYFDGQEIEDVDTVKDVAKHLGFEKAAEFTAALRDQYGVDTRKPGEKFEFTHNGIVVTAVNETEGDEEIEDEDENGDEETSEDNAE